MINTDDLVNLQICEMCNVVFMPTERELESGLRTRLCKECKEDYDKKNRFSKGVSMNEKN